jgi:hypothetical protein
MSDKSPTTNSVITDLNSLRGQLDNIQQAVLNKIWMYYQERNDWVITRELYKIFGKDVARAALVKLGGSIVLETQNSGKKRFQLTFLGILLTDQGIESEELLITCP